MFLSPERATGAALILWCVERDGANHSPLFRSSRFGASRGFWRQICILAIMALALAEQLQAAEGSRG